MLWCNLVSFSKFLASYPRTQVLLPPKVPGMSVLAPAPSLLCVALTLGLHHAFTQLLRTAVPELELSGDCYSSLDVFSPF